MRWLPRSVSRQVTRQVARLAQKFNVPAFGAGSGWHYLFRERDPGSWQRDIRMSPDEVRQHPAVFSCMSLIANDISKCRPMLEALTNDGIWQEVGNPAYSPVLTKPNHYQNRIDFLECWLWSKLGHGNFYGLKVRDNRNVVVAIYPLDPFRVLPLISNDGNIQVFYQLNSDNMAGIESSIVVPAREIIHDRWYTMHHPLIGVSPLFAAYLPAVQGLQIQKDAIRFFRNGAQPSGVLTAPGIIDPDTAKRLEDKWENDFSGENVGRIAVLGSALKFEAMSIGAAAAQVVEQLKWSGEQVCSTFHVPPYKVGLGSLPAGLNISQLNIEYYMQALQSLIEKVEICLSEGLNTGTGLRVSLDIKALQRMDAGAQMTMLADAVKGGVYAPNEARAEVNKPPVKGGESPYLQQQNYSLEALAKRDAMDDPFANLRITETGNIPGDSNTPTPPPVPAPNDPNAGKAAAVTAEEDGLSDGELAIFELSFTRALGIVGGGESRGIAP